MKEEIINKISDLVERFARNKDVYKNPKYNETQLRREFLDPFFSALGWDMDNKQGNAEQYKDIVHEDAIKITGTTKAPDYSFRIGGVRKFFVEAKKPAVDVKYDIHPSFQLRRYAWSAKLPISILTDFEEFSVYDCRIKPNKNDKASVGRIYYQTFNHYLEDLDFLDNTFSRDAILKGSFDKYTETATKKRGTSEVDQEFLKEIENWRDVLAKNIALRNKELSIYELNRIVQLTIDRIIFLRIAEDRGVEEYRNLFNVANKKNIYKALFAVFVQADEKYNSGIFNFKNDLISRNILLDDKVLKPILQKLYYPDSPYEFSVLPSDILGNIYEQFLGKTIRLTPSHQAKIEEKPEVRKAGGVYYTPRYIVDYIVKNTVGEKIKGKTPTQISKLTICDPACGSGSFLIQAYQYLLDHHLEFYQYNPKKYKDKIIEIGHKSYQLTTKEKKRILLNNIYGVDIDPQAVEVTKLSLLLKVLEGENRETLNKTLQFFHERALPNLSDNIKCGNSLIGTDYYDNVDMSLFGNEEMRKINAFDWEKEFPQIFKTVPNKIPLNKGGKLSEAKLGDVTANSGFDVVIGNPPWISLTGKFGNDICSNSEIDYMIKKFNGNTYMPNIYEYFITQGINLTSYNGFFSFIVPDRLGFNDQFIKLRKKILSDTLIVSLLFQVPFPKITADTLIFVLRKNKFQKNHHVRIFEYSKAEITRNQQDLINDKFGKFEYFDSIEVMKIINKIAQNKKVKFIKSICRTTSGFGGKSKVITEIKTYSEQIPVLKGNCIRRYFIKNNYWFTFIKSNITGRTTDKEKLGASPKILIRKTGNKIISTFINSGIYPEQSLYFLFDNFTNLNFKYILALLNSQLINFYYFNKLVTNKKSIAQIKKEDLDQIPIYHLELNNKKDKKTHDTLVVLVDQMLETQKQYHSAKMERDKKLYKQKIDEFTLKTPVGGLAVCFCTSSFNKA